MEPFTVGEGSSEDDEAEHQHGDGLQLGNVVAANEELGMASACPLLLFDLNGVLINESEGKRRRFVTRPQLELLLLLVPRFQIGVFSSATFPTVRKGLAAIHSQLARSMAPGAVTRLFAHVLDRSKCTPDEAWRSRPGGKSFDTQKPLALNGLDLSATLLFDNEAHKACPGEEGNVVVLPTWETAADGGVSTWRTLVDCLLQLPLGCADLRPHAQRISQQIQSVAAAAAMAGLPKYAPGASFATGAPTGMRRVVASLPLVAPLPPSARSPAAALSPHWQQLRSAEQGAPGPFGEEGGSPSLPRGKRMRVGGARDVTGGVAPSADPQRYRDELGEEEGGFPRSVAAAQGWAAPPQHAAASGAAASPGRAGHKRGRQLPGAEPLYQGPRGAHAGGGEGFPGGGGRLSALHHEVEAFARHALPSDSELQLLSAAMVKIHATACSLWPQASTHLFGSQASGLALPGSDLDVVILGVVSDCDTPAQGFTRKAKGKAVDCLRELVKALKRQGIVKKPEVIDKAKVPIIKTLMVNLVPGALPLAIDICVGVANGASAVSMVRRAVLDLPPLRPMCLVLKALLREMGLNEVFQGGLSSYSLVNMIIAHLQCEGWDATAVVRASAEVVRAGGGGGSEALQQQQEGDECASAAAEGQRHSGAGAAGAARLSEEAGASGSGSFSAAAAAARGAEPGSGRSQALAREQTDYLKGLCGVSHRGYDLGLLLTSFLQRFGCAFSYATEAVSITRGGVVEKPSGWALKTHSLGVEDPQQVGRDIGGGSYNMMKVRQVFQEALAALRDAMGTTPAHGHGASAEQAYPSRRHHHHYHSQQQQPAMQAPAGSGGEEELGNQDKWAAIQRDGQSKALAAVAAQAHAAAAAAVAAEEAARARAASAGAGGGDEGDSPTLLDYILDVKQALSRQVTQEQRQQAVPRLEQRRTWLRAQGRSVGLTPADLPVAAAGGMKRVGRAARRAQQKAETEEVFVQMHGMSRRQAKKLRQHAGVQQAGGNAGGGGQAAAAAAVGAQQQQQKKQGGKHNAEAPIRKRFKKQKQLGERAAFGGGGMPRGEVPQFKKPKKAKKVKAVRAQAQGQQQHGQQRQQQQQRPRGGWVMV